VVESVKAAADIYCPIHGEVVEVNEAVIENPQLVNQDPYGKGWLFRVKPHENGKMELLNAGEYSKVVSSEAH
jgi:glycine cleavage system H protein